MNEVRALVEAFDAANLRGERCALATVVSVEGSSYRRPGARMLVCEGGKSTGTISAGCLEADVVEHAKRVIKSGAAKLVEYDTASTGEEMAWGLGLGCNGVVRVLVEPLGPASFYVEALRRSCDGRAGAASMTVATVYQHATSDSIPAASRVPIGARLFIDEGGETGRENLSEEVAALVEDDVRAGAAGGRVYEVISGSVKVFVETLVPPVPLVVFGAGHDALPVVLAALGAGCRPVIVVTGAHAELSRRELYGLDVREVLNPRWETGMASSVRAGVEALVGADADAEAAVLLLCDQPHVTAEVISDLVAAHRATGSAVVATAYGGSFGVPALFGRALFVELAQLEGAAGAKQVIKRYAAEAHFLPFPGGEVDVDTPDDFSRLTTQGIEREQS